MSEFSPTKRATLAQEEIEILLKGVVQSGGTNRSGDRTGSDEDFDLTIELGSAQLPPGEALALTTGSVIALDQQVSEPVEIWVGGSRIARGEVVVMNEKLCVRVLEMVERELAKAG